MPTNRRFLLIRRHSGTPVAEDFVLVEEAMPELAEGQFLIRNRLASLDPAIRGWMDDAPSYMPPIPLGSPVRASTVVGPGSDAAVVHLRGTTKAIALSTDCNGRFVYLEPRTGGRIVDRELGDDEARTLFSLPRGIAGLGAPKK